MIRKLWLNYGLIELIEFESKLSKVEFIDLFHSLVRNDSSWQLYSVNNFQISKYKYRGYILDDYFKLTFETGSNSKQANYGGFCEGEIIELNDKIQLKIQFGPSIDNFKMVCSIVPLLGLIGSCGFYFLSSNLIISLVPILFFSCLPFINLLFSKESSHKLKKQLIEDFKICQFSN